MLDKSDTEIVREWINLALKNGAKLGKDAKGLAHVCSVSTQAVNGWKSTGRITKSNLERAALYFGHSPSFVQIGLRAHEPSADAAAWPFRSFTLHEIRALKPRDLQRIDKMVRLRLDEIAEDRPSAAVASVIGKRRR